ncbi:MAG: hypothetical protein IPP58_14255 [Holophagaceae bacterium]|uniref:Uncharacterized protein n=1 Tax=Candidatus Geothrix skivensis TaxID=2954439 RepID=A0A9D7SJF0_9BACT|nr:hypothetical protein [Candidatus Geothrix skivensis]
MTRFATPTMLGTPTIQIVIMSVFAFLLSNVSAIVDSFLHPEIPYFDEEHLIVGGITGAVSLTLLFLARSFLNRLVIARERINRLEIMLPICASCKKIRKPDSDPHSADSWQAIESYITEKTKTEFSHGICPECLAKLYPENHCIPPIGKGSNS